ncbi:MAG: hypothetical protein ACOYOK_02630 [Pseudobdellovibrionaceae bacterium]
MKFNLFYLAVGGLISAMGLNKIASAAEVQAVKSEKVLIILSAEDQKQTQAQTQFYLVHPQTRKKTAIIQVLQVKENKAVAKIIKGKAEKGFITQAYKPGRNVAQAEGENYLRADSKASAGYLKSLSHSYGVLGYALSNSMSAKRTSTAATASSSMVGTGFGVGGYYDYVFNPNMVFRASAALEQFQVSGTISNPPGCESSTACTVNILYGSGYGLGKYYFTSHNRYRFWGGAGAGYLIALSKTSSILNESQISTNQVYVLAAGADWQISRKNYVPISIEYSSFPASDTVTASFIAIKAGWAWNL